MEEDVLSEVAPQSVSWIIAGVLMIHQINITIINVEIVVSTMLRLFSLRNKHVLIRLQRIENIIGELGLNSRGKCDSIVQNLFINIRMIFEELNRSQELRLTLANQVFSCKELNNFLKLNIKSWIFDSLE